MTELETQIRILALLTKLSDTIWDWMYSWEEVKRHILQQRDNLKELYFLINKKW